MRERPTLDASLTTAGWVLFSDGDPMHIQESDLHSHLRARMAQRGVTLDEIQRTLDNGWRANDAREGTLGKVFVFNYRKEWEGQVYEEKEVSVYYRLRDGHPIFLTVKARYGKLFPRSEV